MNHTTSEQGHVKDQARQVEKLARPGFNHMMENMLLVYLTQAIEESGLAEKSETVSVCEPQMAAFTAKDNEVPQYEDSSQIVEEDDHGVQSLTEQSPVPFSFKDQVCASPRSLMMQAPKGKAAVNLFEENNYLACLDFLLPQTRGQTDLQQPVLQLEKFPDFLNLDKRQPGSEMKSLPESICSEMDLQGATQAVDLDNSFSPLKSSVPTLKQQSVRSKYKRQNKTETVKSQVGGRQESSTTHRSSKDGTKQATLRQKRITFEEQMILNAEFDKDQDWSVEKMEALAQRFGYKRIKIYKWHYDRVRVHQATQKLKN